MESKCNRAYNWLLASLIVCFLCFPLLDRVASGFEFTKSILPEPIYQNSWTEGLTRGMICLYRGDLQQSISHHPLALGMTIFLLVQLLARPFFATRARLVIHDLAQQTLIFAGMMLMLGKF